jgi:hypothetical protein
VYFMKIYDFKFKILLSLSLFVCELRASKLCGTRCITRNYYRTKLETVFNMTYLSVKHLHNSDTVNFCRKRSRPAHEETATMIRFQRIHFHQPLHT